MTRLRFINQQYRGDLRWPFDRISQFTVMDETGRTTVSIAPDENGEHYSSPTFYPRDPRGQQNFYPLSARMKR